MGLTPSRSRPLWRRADDLDGRARLWGPRFWSQVASGEDNAP